MFLSNPREETKKPLLNSELVEKCEEAIQKISREIDLLEKDKKKLNIPQVTTAFHKQLFAICRHYPAIRTERIASLNKLFTNCTNFLKELKETPPKAKEDTKQKAFLCSRLAQRTENLHKRMEETTKEILSTLKTVNAGQRIQQRKLSGEVEVYEISDVVIEKQKMAECNDAYFNAQIIEERQRDIEHIESIMTNLYEMTKELAQVVEDQDEKFVRLEQNARTTNINTKKANKEIIAADENRGLANSKMLFLLSLQTK